MERIRIPMFRYGEADFDRSYLQWGIHDAATQAGEAQSVLGLLPAGRPLRILDLACGVGRHAIYWAGQRHDVTGADLSKTFVDLAIAEAAGAGGKCSFIVGDIRELPFSGQFDVVTWIERSFFDEKAAAAIHRYLAPGGVFIMDVRNPEHPRLVSRKANWRTWREEGGRFLLERHETDADGLHEDVWIEIDPAAGKIIEKSGGKSMPKTLDDALGTLKAAGFGEPELRTMAGEPFTGGPEPYWLWALVRKKNTADGH